MHIFLKSSLLAVVVLGLLMGTQETYAASPSDPPIGNEFIALIILAIIAVITIGAIMYKKR